MPIVGCPKCNKQFKLAPAMLGKTIRCTQCKTAFKTSASQTANAQAAAGRKQGGRPAPPAKAPTKKRPGGRVTPQISGRDPLFSEPIPDPRSPNPLGNFALEDPGFQQVDVGAKKEVKKETVPETEENKHLFANPALKSLAKASKKKAATQQHVDTPTGFRGIKPLAYVITGFGSISALCFLLVLGVSCLILLQLNGMLLNLRYEWIPGLAESAQTTGLICGGLSFLLTLVYLPLAHANTTAMGARGQVFSPAWMVFGWFIPVANLIWPMQGVTEIFKASEQPNDQKWKKLKVNFWQPFAWVICIVLLSVSRSVGNIVLRNPDPDPATLLIVGCFELVFSLSTTILLLSMVLMINKAQYKHFAKK